VCAGRVGVDLSASTAELGGDNPLLADYERFGWRGAVRGAVGRRRFTRLRVAWLRHRWHTPPVAAERASVKAMYARNRRRFLIADAVAGAYGCGRQQADKCARRCYQHPGRVAEPRRERGPTMKFVLRVHTPGKEVRPPRPGDP
jgi:hypothetical protein